MHKQLQNIAKQAEMQKQLQNRANKQKKKLNSNAFYKLKCKKRSKKL